MRLGNPKIAVDTHAEENGKWVECPEAWWYSPDKPMSILIRGATTRRHSLLLQRLTKGLTAKEIDERAIEIQQDLACDVILNWENHFDTDGNTITYSPDVASKVIHNHDNRRYTEYVISVARSLSTFNPEQLEEVEKN
jgi:hypothetical protein